MSGVWTLIIVVGLILLIPRAISAFTPPADPEVTSDNETFNSQTEAEAWGNVTNKGGKTAKSVVLHFYVIDKGATVGRGEQALGDLQPGAIASFDIKMPIPNSDALADPTVDLEWEWTADECPVDGIEPSRDPAGGYRCMTVPETPSPS